MNQYALQEQSYLQGGKYRIIRVLGQGGFGITYLSEQTILDKQYAIKEFFIRDLCARDDSATVYSVTQSEMVGRYRQKFIKEAKIIARLEHPGIVRINDFFEENNTVYYVMEYVEGESLEQLIQRVGPLSEKKALYYITKVADALSYIHQSNVNHLDIKPANIMVKKNNDEPVLIDFGVSKQYDEQKDQTTTTPPGVSNGYSPLEQYRPGGVSTFSPQADIYALGATLYKLLTGKTPPNVSDMLNDGLPPMPIRISQKIRKAIEKAMQPRIGDRPKSVADFIDMLNKKEKTIQHEEEETKVIGVNTKEETIVIGEEIKEKKDTAEEKKFDKRDISEEEEAISKVAKMENKTNKEGDKKIQKTEKDKEIQPILINNPIINNLIANMVEIKGGTFEMGKSPTYNSDAYPDEKPVHKVTLSSFCIGRYEVTQEEWETVMGNNPSKFKGNKRPVEQVSWDDCQAFIRKLNIMTGKQFRLPTEAEWEFAAKESNPQNENKYSGSNLIKEVAWYNENSEDATHDVGTKSPNALGLYDMSGNVWEWCNDLYGKYNSASQKNPQGPTSGSERVRRGGSWRSMARFARVSYRFSFAPGAREDNVGFRLAL